MIKRDNQFWVKGQRFLKQIGLKGLVLCLVALIYPIVGIINQQHLVATYLQLLGKGLKEGQGGSRRKLIRAEIANENPGHCQTPPSPRRVVHLPNILAP